MAICNDGVAMKAGTNAGIIANLLMGLMEEGDAVEKFGRTWCRCSFKSITVIYPFLSMAQVEYEGHAPLRGKRLGDRCGNRASGGGKDPQGHIISCR